MFSNGRAFGGSSGRVCCLIGLMFSHLRSRTQVCLFPHPQFTSCMYAYIKSSFSENEVARIFLAKARYGPYQKS